MNLTCTIQSRPRKERHTVLGSHAVTPELGRGTVPNYPSIRQPQTGERNPARTSSLLAARSLNAALRCVAEVRDAPKQNRIISFDWLQSRGQLLNCRSMWETSPRMALGSEK